MKRSVFIFPEGTRSLDGQLRDFKGGAFTIARKSGCRIVPVLCTIPVFYSLMHCSHLLFAREQSFLLRNSPFCPGTVPLAREQSCL